MCATMLAASYASAQTIQFTVTPGTSAVEESSYSGSIEATITNNAPLTYSAPVLPSWLQLETPGTGGIQINNTTIYTISVVAQDTKRNRYAFTQNSLQVYKILPDGSTSVWTNKPDGICFGGVVHGDYLYFTILDGPNSGIQRLDLRQTSPTAERLYNETGLCNITYYDGSLYAANYAASKIIRLRLSDNVSSEYAVGTGNFQGLGFTPSGELLVAAYNSGKILKYTPGHGFTELFSVVKPIDVKVDLQGNIYVSFLSGKIRRYKPDYSSFEEVSATSVWCYGMSVAENGTLLYIDYSSGKIFSLSTTTRLSGIPTHADVGDHPVTISATDGTVSKDYSFVITVTDPNPPALISLSPGTGLTDIALRPTLTLTFNESIVKGAGQLYIQNMSNGQVVESIDVSESRVTISDNVLQITLDEDLPALTELYLSSDIGIVKDSSDNNFEGICGPGTWSFTTMDLPQNPQTISFAHTRTITYGADELDPGATASSALDITYTSSDEAVARIVDGKIQTLKAGQVTITANQPGNSHYLAADPVDQVLTVSPREITISLPAAPSLIKVYDGSKQLTIDPNAYVLHGLVNDDEVSVASATAVFEHSGAGSDKPITATGFTLAGADRDNYVLTTTSATATGTIQAAPLTVVAEPKSKVYGTADPGLTYQATGLINGDQLTGQLERATGKTVGDYPITVGTLANSNYDIQFEPATLTITPAPLVIRAEDKSRDEGTDNPAFTFHYTGLAAGDNAGDLETLPQAQTTATSLSAAGKYEILASGAASPNYSISYEKGELTVLPVSKKRLLTWTSGSTLYIRIHTEVEQQVRLTLFTTTGQALKVQRQMLTPGANTFTMPVGSLASTNYILYAHAQEFKESQRIRIR